MRSYVDRMPAKRNLASTALVSDAPAMNQATIRQLVVDSVAAALEAQAGNMENADNTNKNPEPREAPVARKRRFGLIRWFERIKSVLAYSNCIEDCKVKFATEDEFYHLTVKGNDLKTYVRRFQELATLSPNMVSDSEKTMEAFIGGLPQSIEGNVTASKSQTLEEAINIAQRLMDQGCILTLLNQPFKIDLMPIKLGSFDVVVGMDWLSNYHAKIICDEKVVHIPIDGETLIIQEDKRLENIPVVREFLDVFPKDLPGLPPVHQVEFQIDLIPEAAPVARAPYRLAPSKMQELSDQLQELADRVKDFMLTLPRLKLLRIGHLLTPTEIRQFLGLVGYYQRFIKDFLKIAKFLTELTQKNKKYIWGEDQETAFQLLKQKLCEAPILALPEGNDDFVVYCDAFHQAQTEAIKEENIKAENLRGMDKAFEIRLDGTRCIKNQSWLPLFDMSTTYHPEIDGQSERTIQTLKDMLRACVIDLGKEWEKHLPLVEFSYNNSYHDSIKAVPFEALYGRSADHLFTGSKLEMFNLQDQK
nr:hypothetical protein [Tanacetum cinerariifolium]